MARLTPLAVSTLALLAEHEMHPYEMYQLMLRRREDRVINVSAGSLYRAVERLASDQLISASGVERAGHRPERTVYAITDAGREALRETLAEMLSTHVNEFPQFPVAIREVRNLPAPDVARLLRGRLAEISDSIQFMDAALDRIAEKALARHFVLDVHYARAMLDAEAHWIAQTISEIDSGDLSWTVEDTAAAEAPSAASAHPEAPTQPHSRG